MRCAHSQMLLHKGDGIYQMMQVTGEEGITLEDYVTYQKSLFLDMVYLQQDAFDQVDASTSAGASKGGLRARARARPTRLPSSRTEKRRAVSSRS